MRIEGHDGNRSIKLSVARENEKFFGVLIFLFAVIAVLVIYL